MRFNVYVFHFGGYIPICGRANNSKNITVWLLKSRCTLVRNVFFAAQTWCPFVLHTFCYTWTWKMTMRLQKKIL